MPHNEIPKMFGTVSRRVPLPPLVLMLKLSTNHMRRILSSNSKKKYVVMLLFNERKAHQSFLVVE